MPEIPDTKGPAQVNSPTAMGGGTAAGVREVSCPRPASNAGNCLLILVLWGNTFMHNSTGNPRKLCPGMTEYLLTTLFQIKQTEG